jgi:hypothetical protein
MERVFITRPFGRWMHKMNIVDKDLCLAVDEMARGLIDAGLGGNMVKKRLALPGEASEAAQESSSQPGKRSGGFSCLVLQRMKNRPIDVDELKALQELARQYLKLDERQLGQALCHLDVDEIAPEKIKGLREKRMSAKQCLPLC